MVEARLGSLWCVSAACLGVGLLGLLRLVVLREGSKRAETKETRAKESRELGETREASCGRWGVVLLSFKFMKAIDG